MIRKKSAMATARISGRRNLEFFASTGVLKVEAKVEAGEWEREAFQAYQDGKMPRTQYQTIRLLRDYVDASVK